MRTEHQLPSEYRVVERSIAFYHDCSFGVKRWGAGRN